jgi:RNA polymerase sigma-70 factor (ECF subfamily)
LRTRLDDATDEELTARIARQPDEDACAELFRRYSKRIYLWCFRYTHDENESVDLAQEIFIKIFRNISLFSGRSRFSTWAYQVARNHCLGELAKKRHAWRRRMVAVEGSAEAVLADRGTFERLDHEEDLRRILDAAREVMGPDELEAFILHYREGLTVNEITRMLGCENVTGARTLIQNARRKFKRLIESGGFSDDRA